MHAVQARCSCVQMSSWDSTVVSRQWARVHGWFRGLWSASSLSLNVRHTRLSTVGNLTFPVYCPYLEQSVPTCHVRTLYVCFPRSPQGIPSHELQQLLHSACAVTVVIFGHFRHSFLLTYYTIYVSKWEDISQFSVTYRTRLGERRLAGCQAGSLSESHHLLLLRRN